MTRITYKGVPLFLVGLAITISASHLNSGNEKKKSLPGQVVNNFSVGELLSTTRENLIPVKFSSLTVIRKSTFEKGAALIQPASKKNYSAIFPGNHSRFICWELALHAKPKPFNRDLNLKFRLNKDNGEQLTTGKVDSWIPSNSKTSTHHACWGWPYSNFWETGTYTFHIFPGEANSKDDGNKNKLLTKVYFKIK